MPKRVSDEPASNRVNDDDAGLTQLGLFDIPTDGAGLWYALQKEVAACVDEIGAKEFAYAVDVSASQLSHALAGRERHHVPLRWLPVLLRMAKTDRLLRFLAAMRGRDVVAPEVLTPEEELKRTKQALAKHFGPGGADLIRREVYGR
jgi:hypothetical protein